MGKKEKEKGLVHYGPKEDSLFYYPMFNFISPIVMIREIGNPLPSYFQKLRKSGDERSFVIFGTLLIENVLDDFLELYIPKYTNLKEIKDFTFSLKIELAKSLKLIPQHIFEGMDPIRKIRNHFAHNFKIEKFDDLEQLWKKGGKNNRDQMITVLNKFEPEGNWNEGKTRILYDCLLERILSGLNLYMYHIKKLKEYHKSKEFTHHYIEFILKTAIQTFFPPEFMKKYTDFNSIEDMINKCPFNIKTSIEFNTIFSISNENPINEKRDSFLRTYSKFNDYSEMKSKALREQINDSDYVLYIDKSEINNKKPKKVKINTNHK